MPAPTSQKGRLFQSPQRPTTQDNDGDCHEETQNREGTAVGVWDWTKEDQALRL